MAEHSCGEMVTFEFIEQTFSFVPLKSGANEKFFSVLAVPLW